MGTVYTYGNSITSTSGLVWAKYSCIVTTGTVYKQTEYAKTVSSGAQSATFCESYYFDKYKGYCTDSTIRAPSSTYIQSNTVYMIYTDSTNKTYVGIVNKTVTYNKMTSYYMDCIAYITANSGKIYYRSNTRYGNFKFKSGGLPENGTLIEGSEEDGYYVLQIDSAYYYYVLIE
jgi:hypothetical protein